MNNTTLTRKLSHRRNRFLMVTMVFPALALVFMTATECSAQNSGYYPYTIARPQDRAWIRSLPIQQRPNRPFHFYGNSIRGTSSPSTTVYRPSLIRVAPPVSSFTPRVVGSRYISPLPRGIFVRGAGRRFR